MNRSVIILLAFVIGQLSFVNSSAQIDYQQQYTSAKRLFKENKYNLAMEVFKSLIPYDQNNPFSEYASFYYALSAYHQGYSSVAKDMFSQIKKLYPTWDQIDEVNLWLARIHFTNRDYFQGLRMLAEVKNSRVQKESVTLEKSGIADVTDVETLKMMRENYPNDAVIGEKLALEISKNLSDPEDKKLLDSLIDQFKLKKSRYIEETPPTIYKETYSISLLFPFLINTLEPTINRKRNQNILDLYEGMKLAVDTLTKQGIKLSLRAYDTERDSVKIKTLLNTEELRNTDLIVGPFFHEENKVVQDFSRTNKINLFNPLTNNFELVEDNPYGFLFQPSWATLGVQSAEFLAGNQKNNKCIVFMGETKSDSVLAMNFLRKAAETDLEILQIEKVSRYESDRIISILATPTEFDEFKYPIQFTLPKDSIGCIFVASEDPLIYTKVISSVETRKDSTTIIGSEKWLDQTAVDFEKYQNLGVILFASNFTRSDNQLYVNLQRKFVREHGRVTTSSPYSDYAKLGYDFTLFIGNALKRYGVYFQDAFNKERFPGYLTEGYDFQQARDNQLVPFVKFNDGELVLVETIKPDMDQSQK